MTQPVGKFPSKADVNLKDYILFYSDQLTHSRTLKDNTGKRTYQDGAVWVLLG